MADRAPTEPIRVWVLPKLERMGWIVIRVLKEDRDDEVIDRARTALISRGWRP